MPSYIIDPAAKTVETFDPDGEEDFLDAVRREIGASQLAVMAISNGNAAVWVDQMGMLKPGRSFWRFEDGDFRYAGRSLITAVSPQGLPMAFPTEELETVRGAIVFEPSEALDRIAEELAVARDEDTGRLVPAIVRKVLWKADAKREGEARGGKAVADDTVDAGWSVFERDDGSCRAIRYELRDSALEAVEMVSGANLEEVRRKLPPGLVRIEPEDQDGDLVESWYTPALTT